MSARARAAMGERDANHAQIDAWYRELMCLTFDTHAVGGGFPDLVIRVPTKAGAMLSLSEVKTEDGRVSASQDRFIRDWGNSNVAIVRTREDVWAHVARVRDMFK